MFFCAHQAAKRRVALTYARRVWSLLICAVKNSRTRCAAFGVGVKSGAGRRSGEGARMISVVISRCFTGPLPGRQACDKGRYHTLKGAGRGFFPVTLGIIWVLFCVVACCTPGLLRLSYISGSPSTVATVVTAKQALQAGKCGSNLGKKANAARSCGSNK